VTPRAAKYADRVWFKPFKSFKPSERNRFLEELEPIERFEHCNIPERMARLRSEIIKQRRSKLIKQ
jgi:hypothetical protein